MKYLQTVFPVFLVSSSDWLTQETDDPMGHISTLVPNTPFVGMYEFSKKKYILVQVVGDGIEWNDTYNWLTASHIMDPESNMEETVVSFIKQNPELYTVYHPKDMQVYAQPRVLYGEALLLRKLHERFGLFYFFTEKKREGTVPYLVILPQEDDILYLLKKEINNADTEILDEYAERFHDSKAISYKEDSVVTWIIKDASRIVPVEALNEKAFASWVATPIVEIPTMKENNKNSSYYNFLTS